MANFTRSAASMLVAACALMSLSLPTLCAERFVFQDLSVVDVPGWGMSEEEVWLNAQLATTRVMLALTSKSFPAILPDGSHAQCTIQDVDLWTPVQSSQGRLEVTVLAGEAISYRIRCLCTGNRAPLTCEAIHEVSDKTTFWTRFSLRHYPASKWDKLVQELEAFLDENVALVQD